MYYAATDLEARICTGSDVIVVGGGNSAGQAAIYMAQHGCKVVDRNPQGRPVSDHVPLPDRAHRRRPAYRGPGQYRGRGRSAGRSHLEQVTLEHTPTDTARTVACRGLFCFIGAEPATSWLERCRRARFSRVHPDRPRPARRGHHRTAIRGTRPVAVRDLGDGGVRGRRRAPRIAQTCGVGRGRGIERGPIRTRSPGHQRLTHLDGG